MSTEHRAARRVRGCCSSLTFYRPTHTSRASLSSGSFVPSCCACSSAQGHLEESDSASLCPAAGSAQPAPQTTPSPPAAPDNPTSIHLHAAGLRLLELTGFALPCRAPGACSSWNYITSRVIQSTPHFTMWLYTHTLIQFHFTCFKTVQCEGRPNGNNLYQKLRNASVNVVYPRMGGIYSTNAAQIGILKYFVDNHDI